MQPEEEVAPKEIPLSSSFLQFILCDWQLVFSCPASCLYRCNISHLEVYCCWSLSEMNWFVFPTPQSLPPPSPPSAWVASETSGEAQQRWEWGLSLAFGGITKGVCARQTAKAISSSTGIG